MKVSFDYNKSNDNTTLIADKDENTCYFLEVVQKGTENEQLFLSNESGEGMGIWPKEFYELLDKYFKDNY